ncbi:DEAD/DEAH box helicase [Saccharomonospora halophila]|uniref:DEAD/DEAH box helicase n=1 Tax=Saccharomonospora halophila TaxID=129922 RepID=UPI00037B2843|nr:DEAD/DEAH box helicase [Saccharomonospora halophila]
MTEALQRLHPALVHHMVNTLGWRSLRPLQDAAVGPVLDGNDALLLAPTAGGKTEAACFPVLSAMEQQHWDGLSVLYVCPLKALLNNLLPRLESYAAWLGRRVALWHGDVPASARRRILREPPDILLTTPESIESMLVSANVEHGRLFAGLRAIVVDEVHAFAGDDRGWHLLAVLERLTRVTGWPVQRIGLSATVGNPDQLLGWLQGSGVESRPATVVAPDLSRPASVDTGAATAPPAGDVELDYVGSVANAATVLSTLHRGEKRLVFCDSRTLVEELGAALRERGVTTFLSHASLSLDERHRAEQAFSEARDCVIVATSTLELGVDVGDLDRVIQINAPTTVASFLQRLGRTGRRAGSERNCLFLALRRDDLLWAAALLRLWGSGYVEPITAPPEPRHIVAQQVLALALQENTIGRHTWSEEWNGLAPFDRSAEPVVRHLVDDGFLDRDGEQLFIGPEAEHRFGHRHFMDMTGVFLAPPQFTVLAGRREVGRTDPGLLTEKVDGPRVLLLGGRSWKVTWIDWKRRRCFVEEVDGGGRARWLTPGIDGASHALTRAARDVLLGDDPPVKRTRRAEQVLAELRDERLPTVHPGGTMLTRRSDGDVRWWTWAGLRANATLAATLGSVADGKQRFDDVSVRLRTDLDRDLWHTATADAVERLCLPAVDERAVAGLKFNEALPPRLAEATLAARLADLDTAAQVLAEPVRFGELG